MAVSFGVAKVILSDGTVVEPPLNGITVFTGPNNSGKSLLLREIVTRIHHYPGTMDPVRWVEGIQIHQEGTSEELISGLQERGCEARYHRVDGRTYLPGRIHTDGPGVDTEAAAANWNAASFQILSHLLVNDQWTDQRLSSQGESNTWDQLLPPNHPVQRLWEDKEVHARFSQLFENAFGEPITINRYVPQIRLQIGSVGMADTPPPASPELRAAYAALPYLSEQGDGVRAFANILLHAFVRPAPVIVIDEPEAFLHPPQARLLGRYLSLYTPSPCQVIVATHSADFLSGVLEGNAASATDSPRSLALVRISRANGTVAARSLAPESVTEILDTPLLRYSNIVSGLFHDGVVLCEAEGDCHFYAANFDAVRGAGRYENITFLHVNGKARLGDAAQKLRTCGIPTAIVADFDLLNDAAKIKQIMAQLGGVWEDIRDDVIALQRHAASSVIATPANDLKKNIDGIIGNPRGATTLSQNQIDKISAALKAANGWKFLKASGVTALSGEPHNAAQRLLSYFANLGIFLVPVGELECWIRALPATNKSLWLTRVFEEGYYKAPSVELRDFSISITRYLAGGE
ncbi:ATP-binding protein [Streptomyces sp. NBC_00340]|uniref:AAA family ATPase n=1 Tax=Streptomyces sp. NBC_00340 TaxID=2975716 RepID=UPI00224E5089|nr:AAA family ATPase [Streptomyces sp. NBC_00340]MCX5130871.1 ATP-binding protein [Streptomyces sp. NBC_00340]